LPGLILKLDQREMVAIDVDSHLSPRRARSKRAVEMATGEVHVPLLTRFND